MASVSIIVPIYNMEKLMRKCIDSLLAQTFTDFELLLIDDGSTDGCPAICDEYALKDKRVKAFHKSNGGLSDARNYGLKYATGEYSIFADPDDWVSPRGLDALYEKAKETDADMVMCDIYYEDEYVRHYGKQNPLALNHESVLKSLFVNIGGFTVNKLIRTSLYKKYKIEYPKGIYGCEDQYTMASLFKQNIRIDYVPIAFYHYMYNPNSLTRHYDEGTYQMDLHILDMFDQLLKGTEAYSLAHGLKYKAIFARAFWNGRKFYSSELFKKRFGGYYQTIGQLNENPIVKFCMRLSCKGYYGFAIQIVYILFYIKQYFKKVKYTISKKK